VQPLYALIIVMGFGADGLDVQVHDKGHYLQKGNCETDLEKDLNDARTSGAPDAVRFGGACVVVESR
jgi:hypothetical protein